MRSKEVVLGKGRIQTSTEKFWLGPKLSEGELEQIISSSTPSKLNAWPTSPPAKPTPFSSVKLFVPVESLPLPSARHQLTVLAGSGTQLVGLEMVHLPAPPAL